MQDNNLPEPTQNRGEVSPQLVRMTSEGHATTTSMIIAEGTESQHRAVLQLIKQHLADFEEFGGVAFEMQPFETAGGTQERTIAVLNREHAMLLMTYMRNTKIVREFKKRLIKAFVELEKQAASPKIDGAELTRLELIQIAMNAETERLELEAKNKQLEPKADAYDTFLDGDGTYSIGNVAKMLGTSQNKLFTELRNRGVLIPKGAMRNTPYQKYMHHFAVKAYEFQRSNGTTGTSYTTRVQPSGIDFIRTKIGHTPTTGKKLTA